MICILRRHSNIRSTTTHVPYTESLLTRRIYGSMLSDRLLGVFELVIKNEIDVIFKSTGESRRGAENRASGRYVHIERKGNQEYSGTSGMGMECQLEEDDRWIPKATVGMS
ncbi:uncharacterized protein Bfra_009247 [Botrytis fragariae]|uniref:Uncharacterized protein n=1 Tax=Botrytis fragariae TaxID=1964551 RepID=A0A8H6ANK4_9HELO|nr:uncharacterized protein Bfra_009247 [Botrytis fragariae]KAF5870699.1 hypothetical protein Bfra_009247 [Botrytis fragariae]